jgi:hypothetical protein
MRKTEKYIRENLFPKLEKEGIKISEDYVKRHDGDLCDNILFTKNDLEKRIYRPLFFRDTTIIGGRCVITKLVPGKSKKSKNQIEIIPFTDEMWVDMQLFFIINFFKDKLDVNK